MHSDIVTKQYICSTLILLSYLSKIKVCHSNEVLKALPLWSWDCVNEVCVPTKATTTSEPQSLETCNMLCSSIQLWPQPTGLVNLSTLAVPVKSNLFQLDSISAPSEIVREYLLDAFRIFRTDLRNIEESSWSCVGWYKVSVRITVYKSGDPRMRLDTDESYLLALGPMLGSNSSMRVDILSPSFCGARHGLETLSQLIWFDPYESSLLILQAATVQDAPRFKYRGLLIDTARSYIPLSDLMKTIDAMASSKLNTFHWHVSDSKAFSLLLNSAPQLVQYGAYSPGDVYTPDQVRSLVHRAKLRGIRVLIEVDTPAHVGRAWSWGVVSGFGDFVHCIDLKSWSDYCSEPPCGQLNPHNENLYELLQRMYSEIIILTGVDDLFHLGGDDVSTRCWSQYHNETDPMNLWAEFTISALHCLKYANGNLPNLTLLWSSLLSKRIKTDLKEFVHNIGLQLRSVAFDDKYVTGLRTVLSYEDAWDLNSGLGNWYESTGGVPYNSWQRIYEHRPWARSGGGITLGGEATVWSSTLSESGLDGQIWPRLAALAERLWTDRLEGVTRTVHARLDVYRSRLLARGIQAAPIWSMWCTQNAYTCG